MAKSTNNTPGSFAPIGKVKPRSYTTPSWPTSEPAHPPDPVSKEEREILGFYDQTRAVSIDRDSDLFVYNFKIPQTPRAQRGIGLKVHHPLLGVNLTVESSLFWRPRLLVARMRYLRKTAKYNPYLRHGGRGRYAQEREAIEAFEAYLRLREDEEERKTKVMEKRELMEYVKVLEDRERARQAEEQVDAVRMNKLCEESGLSMERDMTRANIKKGTEIEVASGTTELQKEKMRRNRAQAPTRKPTRSSIKLSAKSGIKTKHETGRVKKGSSAKSNFSFRGFFFPSRVG